MPAWAAEDGIESIYERMAVAGVVGAGWDVMSGKKNTTPICINASKRRNANEWMVETTSYSPSQVRLIQVHVSLWRAFFMEVASANTER